MLTLDGSDAGTATFNHDIKMPTSGAILSMGPSDDVKITHNENNGLVITLDGVGDGSYDPSLELKAEHTDGYGPNLILNHSESDAATDTIYKISGKARNDAGNSKIFTSIDSRKITHGNGSEDGRLMLYVMSGGTLTTAVNIDGSNGGTTSFSNDIKLTTDASVLSLGAGNDATLTHDGTTGLTIAATPISIDSTGELHLNSTTGDIKFQDGGTDQLALDLDGTAGEVIMKLMVDSDDFVFQQYDGTEVFRVEDSGEFNTTGNLVIKNQKEIRLSEGSGNGTNYLGFRAPASVTSNVTFTLPDGDGSSNQVLKTDGSGTLSWTAMSGGSGGGFTYSAITSTTTAQAEYHYSVNTSGGAVTLNLPARSGVTAGKEIRVKLATAGNDLTIDGNGSETIDGSTTLILNVANQSVTLVAGSSTNWEVV